MGNTIGNLFYPDNPKRRERCDQLNADLLTFERDYDLLYKAFQDKMLSMEPILDRILKALGYSSVKELNEAVGKNLSGEARQEWEDLQRSLDETDRVHGVISGVSNLMLLTGEVSLAVFVLFGVMSGGTAFIVGAIVFAILNIPNLLMGIIDGLKTRGKLRGATCKLFDKRRNGKLPLEQMRVIEQWADMFYTFLSMVDTTATTEEILEELKKFAPAMEEPKKMYDEITMDSIDKELRDYDSNRGSFCREDPSTSGTRSVSSVEDEGYVNVWIESVHDDSGNELTKPSDQTLIMEICDTMTEKSAEVRLKSDGDYVDLVKGEDCSLVLQKGSKDTSKYIAETSADAHTGAKVLISMDRVYYSTVRFDLFVEIQSMVAA